MLSFADFLTEQLTPNEKIKELSFRRSTNSSSDSIYLERFLKYKDGLLPLEVFSQMEKMKARRVVKLNIRDLFATQTTVDVAVVKRIVDNFNNEKTNVVVVEYKNKFFILDGHHTVTALHVLGRKQIKAKLKVIE